MTMSVFNINDFFRTEYFFRTETFFRRFTSLETISEPRDPSQMKDLAETHLFGPSFNKFRLIFPQLGLPIGVLT